MVEIFKLYKCFYYYYNGSVYFQKFKLCTQSL